MAEFFVGTDYYGIGQIIRAYSGFSRRLPLPVSIQHGWYYIPSEDDAQKYASENWLWTKDMEQMQESAFKDIRTRAVGAPFLYLLKNIDYRELPLSSRKGSIVFPIHSSDFERISLDYKLYAEMLDDLPDLYKPITVCLYYLDLKQGVDDPFLRKGFTVVSNGSSLYDNDFLFNFVNNTKEKLYAFSNTDPSHPSSALIYASYMGLTSYHYGPPVKEELGVADLVGFKKTAHDHIRYECFAFPGADYREQRNYSEEVLGLQYMLSAGEMKKLLYRLIFNWRYFFVVFIRLVTGCKPLVNIYRSIKKIMADRKASACPTKESL